MHRHAAAIGSAVVLAIACSGTTGPTGPSPTAASCNPTASTSRFATPFFIKPFAGDFPTGNMFDHDKPLIFEDSNGYLLTMCGDRDARQVDGHPGYDWRMAEGTPLLAVADGLVMYAGLEPPFHCPPLGRTVQAIYVQLQTSRTGRHRIHLDLRPPVARRRGPGRHHRRRHYRRLVRQHRLQRHAAPALRRVQGPRGHLSRRSIRTAGMPRCRIRGRRIHAARQACGCGRMARRHAYDNLSKMPRARRLPGTSRRTWLQLSAGVVPASRHVDLVAPPRGDLISGPIPRGD